MRRTAIASLAAALLASGVSLAEEPEWTGYLVAHLRRYPLATAEDVYKFVHQSVYGPAHFIPDVAAARAYLDEELATLPPGPPDEPLVEELSVDMVRVNLRPFVAGGGDREALLAALVASAAAVRGEPETMRSRLAAACRVLEESGRDGEAGRLAVLSQRLAAEGFPARHHSDAYANAYRPAYRVILRALLPGSGLREK